MGEGDGGGGHLTRGAEPIYVTPRCTTRVSIRKNGTRKVPFQAAAQGVIAANKIRPTAFTIRKSFRAAARGVISAHKIESTGFSLPKVSGPL